MPGFCFLRKFANFVVGIQVAGVTAIFGRFGRVSPFGHIIYHSAKENALNAKFAENNMEIVYRELARLVPNPKNPRTATKEAIEKLAESIRENPKFFEARPILLSDRTGELVIIGGERRSQAAMLLNMDKVPTILLQGLTEAEEDEIMVRDNTHTGKWDEAMLKSWTHEQLDKWDAPKWNNVTEESLKGLFEQHEETKIKPNFIVVEVPAEIDSMIIKKLIEKTLVDFPNCKIK